MCFSAAGSLAVSAVLASIGAVSLVHNKAPSHRAFAAVPLLFAAQQATEGVVWLTMDQSPEGLLNHIATVTFLGFALVVWPLWFPWSLRMIETEQSRRRWLAVLLGLGVVVAGYATWILATFAPTASIHGHSLQYGLSAPHTMYATFYVLMYLLPVAGPFFVSREPLSRTTGAVLVASMLATVIIQRNALTSVWCFFAAILSGLMYFAIRTKRRSMHQKERTETANAIELA